MSMEYEARSSNSLNKYPEQIENVSNYPGPSRVIFSNPNNRSTFPICPLCVSLHDFPSTGVSKALHM